MELIHHANTNWCSHLSFSKKPTSQKSLFPTNTPERESRVRSTIRLPSCAGHPKCTNCCSFKRARILGTSSIFPLPLVLNQERPFGPNPPRKAWNIAIRKSALLNLPRPGPLLSRFVTVRGSLYITSRHQHSSIFVDPLCKDLIQLGLFAQILEDPPRQTSIAQ